MPVAPHGNRTSTGSRVPGCQRYVGMNPASVVTFASEVEAQHAGYRRAKDCSEAQREACEIDDKHGTHPARSQHGMPLRHLLVLMLWTVSVTSVLVSAPAHAHRSGCHRWHSCPSDHGTYTCGDLGHCSACPDNHYCTHGSPKSGNAPSSRTASPNLPSQPVQPAAKTTRTPPSLPEGSGDVRGNQRSRVYQVPGCPDYAAMNPAAVVTFPSEAEAQHAGYRKAKNCP
jgi:hypothetical protein